MTAKAIEAMLESVTSWLAEAIAIESVEPKKAVAISARNTPVMDSITAVAKNAIINDGTKNLLTDDLSLDSSTKHPTSK